MNLTKHVVKPNRSKCNKASRRNYKRITPWDQDKQRFLKQNTHVHKNNTNHKRKIYTLYFIKIKNGASLVVQWLRIRLPMQGTWVQALVQEDPTCRGATKPVRHNYWACSLEPASHNYWAHVSQLLKPMCLEPMLCNKRSHRNKKHVHRNEE